MPKSDARASRPKRRSLARTLRYLLHRLFPRHERSVDVAISVALGIWIGILPTLGVALFLTALAAHVARVPKGPALVASFVATPPTLFLFFYPLAYLGVGLPLMRPPPASFDVLAEIQRLTLINASTIVGHLWQEARGHVIAFLVGVCIVSAMTAGIGFALAYVIMERKLRARRNARAERALRALQELSNQG
jgi:uncharacterized protein (DUF2062 family)